MGVLTNPRRERFCQSIAKGDSQRDAYRDAGYAAENDASVDANASRLMRDPEVIDRIAEIQGRAATRAEITKAWIMQRLMRNAEVCLGEAPATVTLTGEEGAGDAEVYQRNPNAANRALELLGKELGMFVDRSLSATTTIEDLLDQLNGPDRPGAGE